MSGTRRSNDWGFPRWRGYKGDRETVQVRLCDRSGCSQPGVCPAPKSPGSRDRWYFCQDHAAEYNRSWNYFASLSASDAADRARAEARNHTGYRQSAHYGWASSGEGTRSREELRALDVLGLEPDVDFDAVRRAWRARVKEVHPDIRPGDEAATKKFQSLQVAYELLRAAEERSR